MNHLIQSAFLGLAAGDALGVPVEFLSREEISKNPVTDMRAYGTHNQPAGTFSDDASLSFCLAEALINGCDLDEIADNFKLWMYNGFWSARGRVFDIGIATRQAIDRLAGGMEPEFAGGFEEFSNGNGSLMRILYCHLCFILQISQLMSATLLQNRCHLLHTCMYVQS